MHLSMVYLPRNYPPCVGAVPSDQGQVFVYSRLYGVPKWKEDKAPLIIIKGDLNNSSLIVQFYIILNTWNPSSNASPFPIFVPKQKWDDAYKHWENSKKMLSILLNRRLRLQTTWVMHIPTRNFYNKNLSKRCFFLYGNHLQLSLCCIWTSARTKVT